jgi:hypothetical protein
LHTYRLFKNNFAFESYLDLDNFNRNILIRFCSNKCISSSISNLHSLQIRSFNGIFWCLPFSISKLCALIHLNVSAKSILTTKRNIKSYFYSKLKPKYNAVWKTEIFNDRPGKQYGNKLRTYRLFQCCKIFANI